MAAVSVRNPCSAFQSRLLNWLRDRSACTDESLVAYLRDLGCDVDRSLVVRWRSGERVAPLGLLPAILGHCPEVARDLLAWVAEPYGLRVVAVEPQDAGDLASEALALAGAAGSLCQRVGIALADGVVTDAERADLLDAVEAARQDLDRVEAAARASAGPAPLRTARR